MPVDIGANGLVGVAFEATAGTYVAPTKYIPIRSEGLTQNEDHIMRRPIRQSADVIGTVPGNEHVEGDIELECLEDCVIYFLYAGRTTVTKTGTTPNFTYDVKGNATALPTTARTLSITIVRAGIVHGYVGCVTSSFKFSIDAGLLIFTASMIARSEASQSSPTATWPTTTPYGPGMYSIEIPTATPVTDTDTFEWTCEDNGEPQYRLKSSGRAADYVKFGERDVTCTMGRDFSSRTDLDAFKAATTQSITLSATKGVNNSVVLLTPVTVKESYEVGLSGQGDLIRAQVGYRGTLDTVSGSAYTITVKTQEDIV